MPLCECGCGLEVNPGRRFIYQHQHCKTPWKPKPEPQLCQCGCGKFALPGNRFIAQHHMRGRKLPPEWIASMKKGAMSRPPVSNITCERISEAKLREKSPLSNGWEIKGGPITTNKDCADYLGCFVAERLLSKIYPDVQVMPHGNHGYDFICNRNMKIDVKSSATGYKDYWMFYIAKNQIADYFLCIAFEDREDLNPVHLWLIPGKVLNNQHIVQISKSTLKKWSEYEQSIDKVIDCCNNMKLLEED